MVMPATATFTEFAKLARVRKSYVTELRKAGRLVLTDDSKAVRVAESLALIDATRDPAKAGVAKRHAEARQAKAAPTTTTEPPAPDADEFPARPADPHSLRRSKAQADREEALARKAERDEQVELGRLLDADQVASAVAEAGTTLRASLEAMPYDLAPELAAISDESQIRAKLTEYVEGTLAELSRRFAGLVKGAGGA